MTIFTENATHLKSTKSKNSNSFVQIQIKPKSEYDFVLRDTEESELFHLVDFGGVVFSEETSYNFYTPKNSPI